MASIVDTKTLIYGKIDALKILNNGYPNFKSKLKNSVPSINNKDEVIPFLVDMVITLLGGEELKNKLSTFLVSELDKLEIKIRTDLKCILNNKINLSTNPSIPTSLISTGITVPIKSIDYYGLLKVDPKSKEGSLLYNDPLMGLSSHDFNTFLYETLQTLNTTETWGTSSGYQSMLDIETTGTTTLNIKVNSSYATTHKLTDLNNDFIDAGKLYYADKVVNTLFDTLFGTISNSLGLTQDELLNKAKMNSVLKSIVNMPDNTIIDDSFFTFSKQEIRQLSEEAMSRSKGSVTLVDCGNYESTISIDTYTASTANISTATTYNNRSIAINNSLKNFLNDASSDSSDTDKATVQIHFIKNLSELLVNTLLETIITPRLITILLINSSTSGTTDGVTFLKNNKALIKVIACSCKNMLAEFLLNVVLKEIIRLAEEQLINRTKEMAMNQLLSILSLIPSVPQQVISVITGG
jgi:hypothetical protein